MMTLQNDMFTVVGSDAGGIRIGLRADHPIYRAHFPGNPITPGVCIVQMVGELLADRVGRRLMLSQVVNLKFVAPLSPVDTPEVIVRLTAVDDDGTVCRAKGDVVADAGVKTKFSVVFINSQS